MFYLIGIGLNDEKDISVKGLEIVKKAKKVFIEDYTSHLQVSKLTLEEFYGRDIISANRDLVEKKSDQILEDENVMLVVGDVFGATTHTDLYLRAVEKGLKVQVVNNVSILNAVGITGLELYKFGKTTSLPYWEDNFKPQTAYDVIKMNQKNKLHTLVLLDIKPDRKMTVNEAIDLLLKIEDERKEEVFTDYTTIVGCARLGGDFTIKFGEARKLKEIDFGPPLHCLIVPGELHFIEEEFLQEWT